MAFQLSSTRDAERLLVQLGQRLRDARLRRNVTIEQLAERSGTTRKTVAEAEKGSPGTSAIVYARCLVALGLGSQLAELAALEREPAAVVEGMPKRLRARP